MHDLISRQAAIDAIVAWTVEDRPDVEMPTDLIDRITGLPSAQPEQRWIPVSERLPDEYKRVLVSDVFGIYVGEFVDAEENWGGEHFINEHGMHSKSVKAWMPLPEPYAERRTDE